MTHTSPPLLVRVAVLVGAAAALTLLAVLSYAHPAGAAESSPAWQLPLPGSPSVLRLFDPPATQWSAGHRGVDLAAAPGTDVLAAGSGVVAFAGQVAGHGVVTVRHGDLRTTYQPVRAVVRVGQRVTGGEAIGTLGTGDHCGTRGCLHWGLLRGERYLDPLSLLRAAPARLIPIWGIAPGAPPSASPTAASTRARPFSAPRRHRGHPSRPPSAERAGPGRDTGVASGGLAAATTAAGTAIPLALLHRFRSRRRPL